MTGELASLGPDTVHVVVDMQRLFDEDTGWRVPTLSSIVPPIARLIEHRPDRALYPRFITPSTLEAANGAWQTYYRQWPQVIRHRLPPGIFDLIAPLARHAAPEQQIDKEGFSAFSAPSFADRLRDLGAATLVLSGVETDVCVLATALDAVDRGFRVVVAVDAVTSFSPAGHRATLDHVLPRFEHMLDMAVSADILAAWNK
jgi:nicotinamidase-related amidase